MSNSASDSANSLLNHPSNYYDSPPSTAWMSSVTDSVGLVLTTLVIVARCYTKFSLTKASGREDYVCILAYLAFTTVVANHIYILGCTLAKLSLLLFLYRIFGVNFKFRVASWTIGAVLIIWTSVTLLLCIFACKPIRASWNIDLYLQPSTECPIIVPNVTNVHGFCNIITDFALLFLPVPMVWNLHGTTKKKLGLAAVLATGVLCVFSLPSKTLPEYAQVTVDSICAVAIVRQTVVWMSIEFSFFIVVATLSVVTPLFKQLPILSAWLPTLLRSKIFRSSNRKRSTLPSSSSFSKPNSGEDDIEHVEGRGREWRVLG
ncbi:MAG: hypothetical protein LQ344_005116 [Seirophora lacunosa]|nr:MAG: hypothetical protein LQ344_005116 [Seirophora lacunosa]